MKDFFVSYNKAERTWAEWIAWQLEEAGHTTIIQAWDFRPGANFDLKMQEAAIKARQTVACCRRTTSTPSTLSRNGRRPSPKILRGCVAAIHLSYTPPASPTLFPFEL